MLFIRFNVIVLFQVYINILARKVTNHESFQFSFKKILKTKNLKNSHTTHRIPTDKYILMNQRSLKMRINNGMNKQWSRRCKSNIKSFKYKNAPTLLVGLSIKGDRMLF